MQARRTRIVWRGAAVLAVAAIAVFASPSSPPASGDTLTLSNGMHLEGKIGKIARIIQNPLQTTTDANTPVMLVDDDLRRVFFPSLQVPLQPTPRLRNEQKIIIEQIVTPGRRISSVGAIIGIEPFDQYGRRTFSLNSNLGRIDVVQVWSDDEGDFVRRPALRIDAEQVEAVCAACGQRWGLDVWAQLNTMLDQQLTHETLAVTGITPGADTE